MNKKEQVVPNVIMATSFIKGARGVNVLTTDNTIESYPACRMRELQRWAKIFNCVILPIRLVCFDNIIKAYSAESIYYAWELYQAFNRFLRTSRENMQFYIIAPLNFLDTYSKMTYSRLGDIIENAYFPKCRQLKAKEDMKRDSCIFAIDATDDIYDPKVIARIGLCWGPEITDFSVDNLPRNNGFQTINYPWPNDVKKVAFRNLDSDHQITNSYLKVMRAFNALCMEFEGACWSNERKHVRIQVAKKSKCEEYINTLIGTFPEKCAELEEIKEYIATNFKINGINCNDDAERPCLRRFENDACTSDERRNIMNWNCWHKVWDTRWAVWKTYYDCFPACCQIKAKCAEKIVTLLKEFLSDFLDQYYVKKIENVLKEQKHGEMLEFIPLIQAIEKDDGDKLWPRKSAQIKKEFPEFWDFYKLVVE